MDLKYFCKRSMLKLGSKSTTLTPEELRKSSQTSGLGEIAKMAGTMRQDIIANPEAVVVETTRETYLKSLVTDTKRGMCSSIAFPHQRCSIGLRNFTTSLVSTMEVQVHKGDV